VTSISRREIGVVLKPSGAGSDPGMRLLIARVDTPAEPRDALWDTVSRFP
jgi:hypothetical protein